MVLKWYSSWTLDVCLYVYSIALSHSMMTTNSMLRDMLFMCKCHLSQEKPTAENVLGKAKTGADVTSTYTSTSTSSTKHSDLLVQSQRRETVEHLYNQMQIFKSILTVDPSWNRSAIITVLSSLHRVLFIIL